MKYKCKLILKNNLYDDIIPNYELVLKYKSEGKLFYKTISLQYLSISSNRLGNRDFQDAVLEEINALRHYTKKDWIRMITDKIKEEEKEVLDKVNKEVATFEAIKKFENDLKSFNNVFEIEI
jgi:hypothetical protein